MLISKILMLPFTDWIESDIIAELVTRVKREFHVPDSLINFLQTLGDRNKCQRWSPLWILDHPFFWDSVKKFSFIRKLHSLGCRLKLFDDVDNLDVCVDAVLTTTHNQHWSALIPARGAIKDVYDYKKKYYQNMGVHFKVFIGMVVLFRNILAHYNDYSTEVLPDEKVVEEADEFVTGGVCWRLRAALDSYFWAYGLRHGRVDPNFLLSRVPL